MAEQSRELYQIYGAQTVQEMETQLNMILNRLSDRLDQMEGLKGNPAFYKTLFDFPGGIVAGRVLKAVSENQMELSSLNVTDVENAVPDLGSGTPAQIDISQSLISLVDINDTVVHQFPTQCLEYNTEVSMFATIEGINLLETGVDQLKSRLDAIAGLIEGDGAGNYAAATTLSGRLLVKVYDENDVVIHQYPLAQSGQSSELFGFH
jgi:hypothetical protein